jgi:tetratricopeptide (TPR) repeat protein
MNDTTETNPNILVQQAMELHRTGQVARAAEIYRQLLGRFPRQPQLLYLLGTAELTLGNAQGSVELLQQSLQLMPNQPETLSNLGNGLHQLGRPIDALVAYTKAITCQPDFSEAHSNRGNILWALKRYDEALAAYTTAIALKPDYAVPYGNRGNVLRDLKRYDEALADCDRAIALAPNYAEAHNNRGNVLRDTARPAEALASYDRAIALKPDYYQALCNRGCALRDLLRLDEARASFEHALALQPEFAAAYWNKSHIHLLTGDFAEGWKLFEWRWKGSNIQHTERIFPKPRWRGERPIAGKTLLIHAEQGFGDTLQFCRYAPLIAALGARVVIEAPRAILPVLATLKGEYTFAKVGTPMPDFDLHCPMMSLPLAFGTTLETIPAEVPYLFADPEKQRAWRERLGTKTTKRIGLVWSGRPGLAPDLTRSMPMRHLAPLTRLPVELHCLQNEIRDNDAAELAQFPQIHTHQDDLHDFADTAALIAELDLVITVDTSVAHLAGSMGRPVWILLPWAGEWRWLLNRTDSPWYPSATLLRQPRIGDWDGVVGEICNRLQTS